MTSRPARTLSQTLLQCNAVLPTSVVLQFLSLCARAYPSYPPSSYVAHLTRPLLPSPARCPSRLFHLLAVTSPRYLRTRLSSAPIYGAWITTFPFTDDRSRGSEAAGTRMRCWGQMLRECPTRPLGPSKVTSRLARTLSQTLLQCNAVLPTPLLPSSLCPTY